MKRIIVDFESYYDKEISVTTQGLRNYVKNTDAYIVSVVSDDIEFCGSIQQAREVGLDKMAHGTGHQFYAANSNFDQAWWEKYFPKTSRPWKCILDQASFHQYPRDLAGVCKVVLREKIDKSIRDEMRGVRYEDLTDERKQQVIDYCLNDSIKEKQALEKMGPMSPVEDALAEHTRMINRRGIHIDVPRIERDLEQLQILKHQTINSLPWVEGGGKPLSYPEFAGYCRGEGVEPPASLDKRDAACSAWIDVNPGLGKIVRNMRVLRGSSTKLKKLMLMRNSADENNTIPIDLRYCGAPHTRRWSSVNVNVQNLDKAAAFEEEMAQLPYFLENPEEEAGIFMRNYFLPPPGKKFGIIDFSQIEPRCANWLVGNMDLLDAIRAGYSYYEAYARLYKGWQGAPGTLKRDYPREKYTKLKNEALGLGYGMGAARYMDYAKVGAEEARATVNLFRKNNKKIVRKWREFDGLIKAAAVDRVDNTLMVEMYTGDWLKHFTVRSKKNGGYESYTTKGDFSQASHQARMWGGTLFENVVQRMARDILGEALLRLEHNGIAVAFHAHDEVITILDETTAENDLKEVSRIMCIPPDWCSDLPLGTEGGVFNHYVKMD